MPRRSRRSRKRQSSSRRQHSRYRGVSSVRHVVIPMPGDGNCLFWSLGYSENVSPSEVRARTVSYVGREWDNHFRHFLTHREQETYLHNMRRNGVWGDELILSAFAQVYGRRVVVHDRRTLGVRSVYGDCHAKTVRVAFSGCHYDAIEER